jgi:CRP/FNR family cyclic AMP-dependent transcriptional regulator
LQELIVRRSVSRTYTKGEVIYIQDSTPKGLYASVEGRVRMVRTLPGGEERLLHVGEPPFWFGEFAVLTATKTLVSVVADTDVHLLVLPKVQFDLIAEDHPLLYKAIALLIAERYGGLLRYLLAAHGSSPQERLRARLEEMMLLQEPANPTAGPVTLNISQADLAVMIGVTRQTVNALLRELQRGGVVETSFRCIRILDSARLRSAPSADEAQARHTQRV